MRLGKVFFFLILGSFIGATAFAQSLCAPAGSLNFPVTLTGNQFGGSGSSVASGNGFVTLNPNNNTATLQLNTVGLGPNVTSVSLFNNGQSFAQFFGGSGTTQSGSTVGFDQNGNFTNTITLTPAQMNAILANPSAFSAGVSTGEFPNGAISGTLMNTTTFGGTFSGTNLVGTSGATNAGGTFSANIAPNATGGGSALFFTFTPAGIGNSFTGLTLNQGGLGAAGTPFLTLSNGGTLTNGSFSGSVPLTDAQTQALLLNPSSFNIVANTAQFPNGAVRAQFGTPANELWLPIAGSTAGALGNQWTTDVSIFNQASAAPATVTVQVFPENQSNATTAGTMNALAASTLTINARNTAALTNIGQTFTNFSGLGALRITSDQPIIAVERVYDANQNANGNAAAAAQPIFARTLCDAVSRGVLVGVAGGGTNGSTLGVHSNIGFFNPTPAVVTVQLNLGSSTGATIGSMQTLTLQPYQLVQMPLIGLAGSGLFNSGSDVINGLVSYQATSPIFAYTSIVNNANGDSHVTFARQDNSVPAIGNADLAAIVLTANQGEVQEGQLAAANGSTAVVRQFAQQMISDHSQALSQAQNVFGNGNVQASTTNATALFLQNQTQNEINTLSTLSGPAFDRTYMQEQVNDHAKLLQLLDTSLIPSASGAPQLTTFLQQMRATVAQHLANAQNILAQLP